MNKPQYLQPVPDGLLTRPSGKWASEKLDYIRRYIDIFETSMRSKWHQRNYIDLFSGPGKNMVKDSSEILLGSPLLSLTTKYPFTGYHFSDLDHKSVDALKLRCTSSPLCSQIQFYAENANSVVSSVVAQIKHSSPRSLNLAVLDPEGLELEWTTVSSLGSLRCDLIIHYSQSGLTRFIGKAFESDDETVIDRFFGTRDWRSIYVLWHDKPHRTGMHRELIDHYKDRLQSLGYQEVKQSDEIGAEPLMRNSRRNAPLYRLIFASKHPLGDEFWQKVTKRDRYGQKRMF